MPALGRRASIRLLKSADVERIIFEPIDVGNTSAKINAGKPFGRGKIFLSKNSGARKRKQRVFFKPVSAFPAVNAQKRAEELVEISERLHRAGVPVMKIILVQHEGHPYLATESFLYKRQLIPKVFPINPKPLDHTPHLLSNLTLQDYPALIKNLAQDTATLLNIGISTTHFDFFGFYPNAKGEWERRVMDTDHLYLGRESPEEMASLLCPIRRVWKKGFFDKEYLFFLEQLLFNVKESKLKTVIATEMKKLRGN